MTTLNKPVKTLAACYFETMRNVHGDEAVERMLATKPEPIVEAPALPEEPFPGHLAARGHFDDDRG